MCSSVHFTAMNDRKQAAHESGDDTSLSLGVGAVVTHWVELEPRLCTSSIRWWRAILSPSNSFMSTYSPLLIFSTMLAGIGESAGERRSGARVGVAGLGMASGPKSDSMYEGAALVILLPSVGGVGMVATDVMLPGAGMEPNRGRSAYNERYCIIDYDPVL